MAESSRATPQGDLLNELQSRKNHSQTFNSIHHLVLVGPEGNQLGEITAQRVQNTSSKYWTLQISPNHQKSGNHCCSRLSLFRCSLCFCGNDESNQSALTNVALWFRPSAIVFLLILAAHIAAISLTASLIAQAQRTDAGLSSEAGTERRYRILTGKLTLWPSSRTNLTVEKLDIVNRRVS
ncbi:hypothetical protein ACTXT7_000887 [Hymenolepis weldensis]